MAATSSITTIDTFSALPISTRRVLVQAELAGMRPTFSPEPRRGTWLVWVNQPGICGAFGGIYIGVRTGRIRRATLQYGGNGATAQYAGFTAVRDAVAALYAASDARGDTCGRHGCWHRPAA